MAELINVMGWQSQFYCYRDTIIILFFIKQILAIHTFPNLKYATAYIWLIIGTYCIVYCNLYIAYLCNNIINNKHLYYCIKKIYLDNNSKLTNQLHEYIDN